MSNKTNKGLAKRFKRTASGKILHKAHGRRHLMSSKTSKRKRQLRRPQYLTDGDAKGLERQFGVFK